MNKLLLSLYLVLFSFSVQASDIYIFTADWCPACKQLKNFIPKNKEVFEGHIVTIIDIDRYPQTKNRYKITSIPTTVALKNGKEMKRTVGFDSSYKNWIKNLEK